MPIKPTAVGRSQTIKRHWHLTLSMIAGNPRVHRTRLWIAVTLLALFLLSAVILSMRRKSEPQPTPPLHSNSALFPAIPVGSARCEGISGHPESQFEHSRIRMSSEL